MKSPRILLIVARLVASVALSIGTSSTLAAEANLDKLLEHEFTEFAKAHETALEAEETPDPVEVQDPWERFNRGMHNFNAKADKYVVRPLGVAYDTVTPQPIQHGVTRFFTNLQSPRTMVNELLQGRPLDAAETLSRFAVNTTVGIGGLFDPASSLNLAHRNEDFGQTLAVWGWENSNYLVLPLMGPRTVRDLAGGLGDIPMTPLSYVENDTVALSLRVLQLADARVQLFPVDDMRADALDEYVMIRDAWMQRRKHQIREGNQPQQD